MRSSTRPRMSTRSCSPTGSGRLGSSNSVRVPRVGERRKRGEMRTHLRLLVSIAAVLVAVIFALPATAAGTTTCTDVLAPGTYGKVVVPAGATCFTDGPVVVRGGLFVEAGATFVLGSEENAVPTGVISGGVHATDAASVQIHFTTINGGVDVQGGSGPFGGPFDITWNAIEDNVINGGATIENYDGFWMGFIRNTVNGSLNCTGNSPAPQIGDSEGSPNTVTGSKTGQCAGL